MLQLQRQASSSAAALSSLHSSHDSKHSVLLGRAQDQHCPTLTAHTYSHEFRGCSPKAWKHSGDTDMQFPLLLPGGTIQSIAAAKAGIMKPGCPVVIAQQPEQQALQVLLDHAHRHQCPVITATDVVTAEDKGMDLEADTAVQKAALHWETDRVPVTNGKHCSSIRQHGMLCYCLHCVRYKAHETSMQLHAESLYTRLRSVENKQECLSFQRLHFGTARRMCICTL